MKKHFREKIHIDFNVPTCISQSATEKIVNKTSSTTNYKSKNKIIDFVD